VRNTPLVGLNVVLFAFVNEPLVVVNVALLAVPLPGSGSWKRNWNELPVLLVRVSVYCHALSTDGSIDPTLAVLVNVRPSFAGIDVGVRVLVPVAVAVFAEVATGVDVFVPVQAVLADAADAWLPFVWPG